MYARRALLKAGLSSLTNKWRGRAWRCEVGVCRLRRPLRGARERSSAGQIEHLCTDTDVHVCNSRRRLGKRLVFRSHVHLAVDEGVLVLVPIGVVETYVHVHARIFIWLLRDWRDTASTGELSTQPLELLTLLTIVKQDLTTGMRGTASIGTIVPLHLA